MQLQYVVCMVGRRFNNDNDLIAWLLVLGEKVLEVLLHLFGIVVNRHDDGESTLCFCHSFVLLNIITHITHRQLPAIIL